MWPRPSCVTQDSAWSKHSCGPHKSSSGSAARRTSAEAAWPCEQAGTAALLESGAAPSRQPAGVRGAGLLPEAAWPWEQAEAAALLTSGELQITWSPALLRLPWTTVLASDDGGHD